MIDRYSTEEMKKIWSRENRFQNFLKVELAAVSAYRYEGIIPSADYSKIMHNAKFNLKEIDKLEKIVKHDLIAFTRSVSKSLGPEKKWIHYNLTSTDVIDTANALLLKEANKEIFKALEEFLETLKENAYLYKEYPTIGRTHGIHAEPTSFGLKWALWYDEMKRNLNRFKSTRNEIETGKISGSVGNFANVSSKIQDKICEELKINSSKISTQVLQRDIHANYLNSLALIGSTLEKIAIEIRTLQRTEINEVEEYFSEGQKGSSSMPHKKNPISSENITGISRLIKGYLFSAYENIPLWNERDISHSSVERIILPDATSLIHYALKRYNNTLKMLVVKKENMEKNIWKTNGLIFSQRVLSRLIEKGYSREEAFDKIQKIALISLKENTNFKYLILRDKEITEKIPEAELKSLFDYKYYLKEVDKIYQRVFK